MGWGKPVHLANQLLAARIVPKAEPASELLSCLGGVRQAVAHAPLQIEVLDDEIIVTRSGSKFRAIYHSVHHKPGEQPQLIVNAAGQLRFLGSSMPVRKQQSSRAGMD
jgi:hypothetical protein